MDDKRKKELIEKYSREGHSLEGLDSCLHGIMLYKTCHFCGRDVE